MKNIQAIKDAQQQSESDKLLGPGHFVYIPKTTVSIQGYREAEVFSLEQLLEYIDNLKVKFNNKIPELAIQKKFDGVSIEIHRTSSKITIFTSHGNEITKRMPSLVKKILDELPKEDYIAIAEVEMWDKGVHSGRSAVSGYLNAKTPPDDSNLVIDFFDVIWFNKKDIHNSNYKDRYTQLKKFNFTQSLITKPKPGFNLVPTFIANQITGIQQAVKSVSKPKESEGAILKFWDGFKFRLNKFTNEMIKYKKFAEGHFTALSKRIISGTEKTFQYEFGVSLSGSEKKIVDESKIIRYNKQDYLLCGKTYNTNIKALIGDILTIRFNNLNVYHNKKDELYLGVYGPTVYENRTIDQEDEDPDTLTTLLTIGEESGLLVEKGIGVYVSKAKDIFMQYPKEGSDLKYVIQEHFRSKTAHIDFRIETKPGGNLIGYTIMNQVEDAIDKSVVTMKQAEEYLKDDENWKYNPLTGNFQYRETKQGKRKASIQTALKGIEPNLWLNVSGVTPKGSIGATKNYPGVFAIAAQGKIEYGFREPYFQEYYVHNKNWPDGGTRLVFRMLASETLDDKYIDVGKMLYTYGLDSLDSAAYNPSDSVGYGHYDPMVSDELRGYPQAPARYMNERIDGRYFFWNLGYFDVPWEFTITRSGGYLCKLLPPGEEPEREAPFIWLTIEPNTLEPYILSSRAEEKKKFPPVGISALPKFVKDQVPKEFKYWDCSSAEEMQTRLSSLRIAIKSKEVVLTCGKGIFEKQIKFSKSDANTDEFRKTSYILKERSWRGPIVVRLGTSVVFFDLYIRKSEDKWHHFVLMKNPVLIDSLAGFKNHDVSDQDALFEGNLPPEHELNPNKELDVQVQILTKGQLSLKEVSENESTWHLEFESGDLKKRSFKATEDADIWKFELNNS